MQQKTIAVEVDKLKQLYLESRDRLIKPEEVTRDITPIFYTGIRQKLIKKERITITIIAQTTKGKSTLGLNIKESINEIIKDLAKEEKLSTTLQKTHNPYELISANQIEYMRIVRRQDLYQVCSHVDEFSPMAKSGLNSSTEENLLEYYNTVCAQKYIHTIYCTPGHEYDKYGLLIIEIIDTDMSLGITKAKLYYNNPTDIRAVPLGHITINVNNTLKSDWYKTYRKRKDFAMDLILQESIKDVRELEFALVTLIAYKDCKRLAEIGKVNTDIISLKLNSIIRETKAVYSLLSKNEIISNVRGLLTPLQEIKNVQNLLWKNRKTPLTETQKAQYEEQISIYKKELQKMLQEYLYLLDLYKKYSEIGNPTALKEIENLEKKYSLKEVFK